MLRECVCCGEVRKRRFRAHVSVHSGGFQTVVAPAVPLAIARPTTVLSVVPREGQFGGDQTRSDPGRRRTRRAPRRPSQPLPAVAERSERARRRAGTSRRCRSARRCRLRRRRARKNRAPPGRRRRMSSSSSTRPARISASGNRALSYVMTSSNQVQPSARPSSKRCSARSASLRNALR